MNESNGLTRLLMTHLTNIQIWLRSLVLTVKIQPVHLQLLFQREEMVLLNLIKMMSQSFQSMIQRDPPPSYLLLTWMMLLLPLLVPQLKIPTILMNLILNFYAKSSKFENANLVVYAEPTKLPVRLDLSKYLFALPDSSIRNSRANNVTIFRMKLVILFWLPCL